MPGKDTLPLVAIPQIVALCQKDRLGEPVQSVLQPCNRPTRKLWLALLASIAQQPAHLLDLTPVIPTWHSDYDACNQGMGGVFLDTEGNYVIWHFPFSNEWSTHLLNPTNLHSNLNINITKLVGHLAHLSFVAFCAKPLLCIHTACDNKTTVTWVQRGSGAQHLASTVLLQAYIFLLHQVVSINDIIYLLGHSNTQADDDSRL
eukprot:11179628-Ditylum_brightwellii.AAC.1